MRQLFLLILITAPLFSKAQTVDDIMGELMTDPKAAAELTQKAEPVKKTILDSALFHVYYDYTFQTDPASPKKQKGITVLQIGKQWLKFTDYNELRADSLIDAAALEGKKYLDIMMTQVMLLQKKRFHTDLFTNLKQKTNSIETQLILIAPLDVYTYDEALPDIRWQLQDGDTTIGDYTCKEETATYKGQQYTVWTTIGGYACKKATATYRGRQYTAWYAPEVKLPFGPYIFGGLPGLIFSVADTRNHYRFTLAELSQLSKKEIIYKKTDKKIIPLFRDKVRQIDKNYHDNPAGALGTHYIRKRCRPNKTQAL